MTQHEAGIVYIGVLALVFLFVTIRVIIKSIRGY